MADNASPNFDDAALGGRDPDVVAAVESLVAEGFRVQNRETHLLLVNSKTGEAASVTVFPKDGRASTIQRGPISGPAPEVTTAHDYLDNRKSAPANDIASKATLEIGDVALAGEHKGEIYGGILPGDNKPIWFLAAPKLMDHYKAAAWATEQGGALPTRKQGDYLTTLKGKGGAVTELFNRGGSFPAGYVWLAEPDTFSRNNAWCQRLSDGDQYYHTFRNFELPVLCVRR